jgi:spire-like protein
MCKKTRFSLFHWGTRCSLCSQQVCSKCVSKMRIPLEHFASVPVSALTPNHLHPPPPSSSSSSSGASPLSSLSPIPPQLGSLKERMSSPNLTLPRGASAGSAPTSPNHRRRCSGGPPASDRTGAAAGPTSLPVFTSQGITTVSARLEDGRRHSISRDTGSTLRSRRESIQGTPLTVCHDCKEMVLQVVRSQSTARRVQMTRSLYLQLSPGYTPEI